MSIIINLFQFKITQSFGFFRLSLSRQSLILSQTSITNHGGTKMCPNFEGTWVSQSSDNEF